MRTSPQSPLVTAPPPRSKKIASATVLSVTEAVKNNIIAVPLRFIAYMDQSIHRHITVAFRKTILAVLKKTKLSRFVLIGCISPCSNK